MRILYVADLGSPIAQSWVRPVIEAGHEVHAVSTYMTSEPPPGLASFHVIPVALSGVVRPAIRQKGRSHMAISKVVRAIRALPLSPILARARYALGLLDVVRRAPELRRIVDLVQPDLVHALRLPFEGFLAAQALRGRRQRLLISIWGNDFTLHARRSRAMHYLTRRALHRADALHPDCHRDLELARKLGFSAGKPSIVAPGSGGILGDVFHPGTETSRLRERWGIPSDADVVLNPRGVRSYVRRDVFFKAIPEILRHRPKTIFLALGNAGDRDSERWVHKLRIESSTRLLSRVPHQVMADYFRLASVTVSPSFHDGTPNTLLEAMACGSFPVAGDLESVREWIDPGVNGLLFAPDSHDELATAAAKALGEPDLRRSAFAANQGIIRERAESRAVFARVERFYNALVSVESRLL